MKFSGQRMQLCRPISPIAADPVQEYDHRAGAQMIDGDLRRRSYPKRIHTGQFCDSLCED